MKSDQEGPDETGTTKVSCLEKQPCNCVRKTWSILFPIALWILYHLDVISDFINAYNLYDNCHKYYCISSLLIIIISFITTTIYIRYKYDKGWWFALRYTWTYEQNMIYYVKDVFMALKSQNEIPEMDKEKMDFNSNVSFFEAITESVLQLIQSFLVLREYGISSDEGTKYTQYVTIVSSLLSIAVALWTRYSFLEEKKESSESTKTSSYSTLTWALKKCWRFTYLSIPIFLFISCLFVVTLSRSSLGFLMVIMVLSWHPIVSVPFGLLAKNVNKHFAQWRGFQWCAESKYHDLNKWLKILSRLFTFSTHVYYSLVALGTYILYYRAKAYREESDVVLSTKFDYKNEGFDRCLKCTANSTFEDCFNSKDDPANLLVGIPTDSLLQLFVILPFALHIIHAFLICLPQTIPLSKYILKTKAKEILEVDEIDAVENEESQGEPSNENNINLEVVGESLETQEAPVVQNSNKTSNAEELIEVEPFLEQNDEPENLKKKTIDQAPKNNPSKVFKCLRVGNNFSRYLNWLGNALAIFYVVAIILTPYFFPILFEPNYKKQSSWPCRTMSSLQTIFPFEYNGISYKSCTKTGAYRGAWCAIRVGKDGKMKSHEECMRDCPGVCRPAVFSTENDLCNIWGTQNCSNNGLSCSCKTGYTGPACEKCVDLFKPTKDSNIQIDSTTGEGVICIPCECNKIGSTKCSLNDECECKPNFSGGKCENCAIGYEGSICEKCTNGYYNTSITIDEIICSDCGCSTIGSEGIGCDEDGQCSCKTGYTGRTCSDCASGYFFDDPECKVCKHSTLACNINGSGKDCNGNSCGNCLFGYRGTRCQYCEDGLEPLSNFNESLIDAKTGVGAECSCECNPTGSLNETFCEIPSGQCRCKDNFDGTKCEECKEGYFGEDVCESCNCNENGREGIDCDENGKCNCNKEYDGDKCDKCAKGLYYFPECKACDCDIRGTDGDTRCDENGQCNCDYIFEGLKCNECIPSYYQFPTCYQCYCNEIGSRNITCNRLDGSCECKIGYKGAQCGECDDGFYGFPNCKDCLCNEEGTKEKGCNESGKCKCKTHVVGDKCNDCEEDFYGFPDCMSCNCNENGTLPGELCDQKNGSCPCKVGFDGKMCDFCQPKFYGFPNCTNCTCFDEGTKDNGKCNENGQCNCKENFAGDKCDQCAQGFYGWPECLPCNCDLQGSVKPRTCTINDGFCSCINQRVGGRECNRCKDGFLEFPNCFVLCGNSTEVCNIHGAKSDCDVDSCGSDGECKIGYIGKRCENCTEGYEAIMGKPGVVREDGEGVVCQETEGNCTQKSAKFKDWGYTVFDYNICDENCLSANVSLTIATYQNFGLILWQGSSNTSFVSIRLMRGKILFEVNYRNNIFASIESNEMVSDNRPHKLSLQIEQYGISAMIDSGNKVSSRLDANARMDIPTINQYLFVGGYPSFRPGFSGCISDINVSRYIVRSDKRTVFTGTKMNFNDVSVIAFNGIECIDKCV